ncbi:MAG: IS256 family transposase [Sphaerochaetaceae bacterium]|jgi:putative transposase
MTESHTIKELLEKLLSSDSGDPLRSIMHLLLQMIMEYEVANKVGAQKGEHTTERSTYLSGTRPRRFDTRLGTINLEVPKLRRGGYVPSFVKEHQRSERALISVVCEAYSHGVSTRKVERLAKALGIESLSASQVSQMTKELDERVAEFRVRSLEKEYAVLWVDALYEKIRENGRVQNMAIMVVKGVTMQGTAQILAVEPMYNESEETYQILFKGLKRRGLEQVWLVVSDAHQGLKSAIAKEFVGSCWQRCKVHFMRNILAYVGHHHKEEFASALKHIWLAPDEESARAYARSFMDQYEDKFPKAIKCLEEGLDDSLQFYQFSKIDHRKIASTNTLERLNREIRRRTRVVGIFPNSDSYVRLVSSLLIEIDEEWQTGRAYISVLALTEQKQIIMNKVA